MSSRLVAAAVLFSLASSPALAQSQPKPQPQQSTVTTVIANYLPVTLWTITGAVIGAVAWPGLAAGTLTITPVTTTAALMNPGTAVGAVVGGVGFLATR